jgi:hypothetical protein
VQQRLRRLITEPEGVDAALAAEGDPEGANLAALIRADRGRSPVDRLAVYANAYFVRLHDCLREDFAALARALGPAGFHDLVKTYLMVWPPTRPSLRHAGANLVEHLATEPFAAIFSRRCPYAADLARLEWAMTEAFYAKDAPVLAREELAAVPPEAWPDLRFAEAPSLQLFTCAWPVHTVRERFDREEADVVWDEAPSLVAEPTHLRVWRINEQVRYRAMPQLEFELLGAATAGETFAVLCDRLASAAGDAIAALDAAALVSRWLSDGILAHHAAAAGETSTSGS